MNDAILVFGKDTDNYTLHHQLSSLSEEYNVLPEDIFILNEDENYQTLDNMFWTLREGNYNNIIYLTEDSDWSNFEVAVNHEYGHLFESITVLPRHSKRLYEADPVQAPAQPQNINQQQTPEEQPEQQNQQQLKNYLIFDFNCPFVGARKKAQELYKIATTKKMPILILARNKNTNQFLSNGTMAAFFQKFVKAQDTKLIDTMTVETAQQTFKNPNVKVLAASQSVVQTYGLSLDPTVKPYQNRDGENQACYTASLQFFEKINNQKKADDEIKKKLDEQQAKDEKNKKPEEQNQEQEQQQTQDQNTEGDQAQPTNESYRIFGNILHEGDTTQQKATDPKIEEYLKRREEIQKIAASITEMDQMIAQIIQEATQFKNGKSVEAKNKRELDQTAKQNIQKWATVLGIKQDLEAGEEAVNQAGYGLVTDIAKAAVSSINKEAKKKKEIDLTPEQEFVCYMKWFKEDYKKFTTWFNDGAS